MNKIVKALIAGGSALFIGCAGTPVPSDVGLQTDGSIPEMAACPSSPNCVSSLVDPDVDSQHGADPISRGRFTRDESQDEIRRILTQEARLEIQADVPGYLHAVQYTAVFKFPDDIEFWFPVELEIINFRSAARLGKSDLGVNRNRIIGTAFGKRMRNAPGSSLR